MKKIIIICGMLLLVSIMAGCDSESGSTGAAVEQGDEVKIPLSSLSSKVQFYEYRDGGVTIKYFAVLGSDGKPRTAFDACDVCGGYKGYQQKGRDIRCRECGKVFSIDGLGTKNKGYGCWPSYLPHEVRGGSIIIEVSDITDGRKRFV